MPLTNRLGFTARVSIRANVTEVAGSTFAFLLTKTRPAEVAAQRVEESLTVRLRAAIPLPPVRSEPKPFPINSPAGLGSPRDTQSPQSSPSGYVKLPVNSLQFARNCASVCGPMPWSLVRQTCPVPAYIVPETAGSEMMGK